MNMTKRDIADIVLVGMVVVFLIQLLSSLVILGSLIGMTDEAEKYTNKTISVVFQALDFALLLLLNYVLLFKRDFILSIVFPDGKEKEISIPSGLNALASYAFWIRIIGVFTFISSGIRFLSRLGADLAARGELTANFQHLMYSGGAELISSLLGLFVVWKAGWIAGKLCGEKGSKKIK